jgi:hypothetical protein
MKMTQITTALTDAWKKLTDKEKKKYEDMAAEDKNRYEKEIEESGAKPTKAMKL